MPEKQIGINPEQSKIPQESRRKFFKRFIPEKLRKGEDIEESEHDKRVIRQNEDISGQRENANISRRHFLETTGKGLVALEITRRFSAFIKESSEAEAQEQGEEKVTDERCEEFFEQCYTYIEALDRKGERKTDALILELADFTGGYSLFKLLMSSRQMNTFAEHIDFIGSKIDDLRTDTDWDIDPVAMMREASNVPDHLQGLKDYGRIVAVDRSKKSASSLTMEIAHFGDVHEWNPKDRFHNTTVQGHYQMNKMFGQLQSEHFGVFGNEGETSVEEAQKEYEDYIKQRRTVQNESIRARVEKYQARLDHSAVFTIHRDFPHANISPIDTYATDHKKSHAAQTYRVNVGRANYFEAAREYYAVKNGIMRGSVETKARNVMFEEKRLSGVEKIMYNDRSRHACRRLIADTLIAKDEKKITKMNAAFSFGMADSKYFRAEIQDINNDPRKFLEHLRADNKTVYNDVMSRYTVEELQELAVDFYTIVPNAFVPEHVR